jgi:hypothetical protein
MCTASARAITFSITVSTSRCRPRTTRKRCHFSVPAPVTVLETQAHSSNFMIPQPFIFLPTHRRICVANHVKPLRGIIRYTADTPRHAHTHTLSLCLSPFIRSTHTSSFPPMPSPTSRTSTQIPCLPAPTPCARASPSP